MRTAQKRMVLLLLALILCIPVMSIRADAVNTVSAMVDGGMSHSIALSSKGTVYVWGSNAQMQLGLANTSAEQNTPRQVEGLSNVVAVAAGYDFSVALSYNGTVYTWGGGMQSSPTAVPDLENIVAISAGQSEILALDRSGNVWQWGLGGVPAQVQGLSSIAAIDAGGGHYLALTFYGDVYAWGDNLDGQLGIGNTDNSATPQKVNLHDIVDIAAGQSHSLAVAFDGTVYAWGLNSYGQLGTWTTADSNVPVQVRSIRNATQVSAGVDTSMARTEDGMLYTWGYGEYGQLGGNNVATSRNDPQTIPDLPDQPVFIACGAYHNLYISQNGSLYAWGRNRNYQLGIQPNDNVTTPSIVNNITVNAGESYQTDALNSASPWAVIELDPLYGKDLIPPIIWQGFQGNITRAEFAHMLVAVYEKVKNTTASAWSVNFKDIKGHIFEKDIIKAYYLGITSGTSSTTFSPDGLLTREQAAKMLCTFLTKMTGNPVPDKIASMTYYADASSISGWAAPYVAYAYEENLMRGYGKTFAPGDYLTREQAMVIVGRVIGKYQWG